MKIFKKQLTVILFFCSCLIVASLGVYAQGVTMKSIQPTERFVDSIPASAYETVVVDSVIAVTNKVADSASRLLLMKKLLASPILFVLQMRIQRLRNPKNTILLD